MKSKLFTIVAVLAVSSPSYAASGTGDVGLLVWLFLGVGAMIVVFQLIPGLILYGSMLKGLFSGSAKGSEMAVRKNIEKS